MASCFFPPACCRTLPRQFSTKSCLPSSWQGLEPAATQLLFSLSIFLCLTLTFRSFPPAGPDNFNHPPLPCFSLTFADHLQKKKKKNVGPVYGAFNASEFVWLSSAGAEACLVLQRLACLPQLALAYCWEAESFIGLPSFTQTVAVT